MNSFRKFIYRLKAKYPRPLPTGVQEFDAFCAELFAAYGIPDKSDYKHAVATMIMHQDPTAHAVAPKFFYQSVKKAQANEVAYNRIQHYNKERDEKLKKEKEETQGANLGQTTSQ